MTEKNATILLVEDDEKIRTHFAIFLRQEGFIVVEAASGEQAIAFLDEERPDLIITDLLLPDADGFAVIEAARALPGDEPPPIFVFSADARDSTARRAREAGALEAFSKPFHPAHIIAAIYKYILPSD